VGDVLEKDELSRKHLRALQEHKRSLKEIQVGLRPNQKNTDDRGNTDAPTDPKSGRAEGGATKPEFLPPPANDRETLLRKKKAAERKIGLAEADWRASLREMREALSGLASPVAPAKPDPNGGGDSEGTTLRAALPPVCFGGKKTVLGGDLERAWTEHTLRRFAAYPWVELPGGVPVAAEPPAPLGGGAEFSVSPDRARGLWGPIDGPGASGSSGSLPRNDKHPVVLPPWIRLLTESLPNKSIWGEKELPRYAALWSTHHQGPTGGVRWLGRPGGGGVGRPDRHSAAPFSLQVVALAAPSVVDAREIQKDLLDELCGYYSDLLAIRDNGTEGRTKFLKRFSVPAPDLNHHEWSRIEVHVEPHLSPLSSGSGNGATGETSAGAGAEESIGASGGAVQRLRLGWVSHWGDAASRACDMAFAGGGVVRAGGKKKNGGPSSNASTKEYVHVVEASVVDDSSSVFQKILYANSNRVGAPADGSAGDSRRNENRVLVDVPPVLVPHLIRPLSTASGIPLEELVVGGKKKKKKKQAIFGVRNQHVVGQNKSAARDRPQGQQAVSSGTLGAGANGAPKFPPIVVLPSESREERAERMELEKLSCPYDFLFR